MYIDGKLVVAYKLDELKPIKDPNIESNRYMVDARGIVIDTKRNKIKPISIDKDGYQKIYLTDVNKKQIQIHLNRLVANEFIERNTTPGMKVGFKDNDKTNTHYSNLIWGTNEEIVQNAYKNGMYKHTTIYTESEINNLCKILQDDPKIQYVKACDLAGITDIGKNTANRLCGRLIYENSWSHVTKNYDFSERVKNKKMIYNKEVKSKILELYKAGYSWDKICSVIYNKPFIDVSINNIRTFHKHYEKIINSL